MSSVESIGNKLQKYIIKQALTLIKKEQQADFKEFLINQGYTVNENTDSNYRILTSVEYLTVKQHASKLTKEFKKLYMNNNTEPSTSNMDSHPNLLSHTQNTVSRDELANILNFIYNNNNKPANNIRIPTPPTYDGTRSVSVIDNWYVSVERYLQFNNFDESRWTEYGVTLLTGRAQLWYARATQRINHNLNSWTVFKSAIDAEFKPQFAAQSARDRLFDLK
ncbi:uncharacterized protein EV154DRAFT_53956 [Mucor mucedo]|uniref:uncharacterized protein n=1 Tax=Mucor mucedo TaxID=29922 RepID=UPI00221F5C69|nr:uncharacterized protein EV154DRAFT_53956 [Mucor mucedo]KAI7878983.1 hypothetical protein EV154DRAFT_53956 [Mucor mucedo]